MNRKILLAALALASAAGVVRADVPVANMSASDAANKPIVKNERGASLDLTDIDAHLAPIPEEMRAGVMNDPDRIDQILNQLLILRYAANEAREMGIDQDPIVAREMKIAGERVLFRYRMNKLKADIKYPDFDVQAKELYAANRNDYMTPELVDVSHILFQVNHDKSEDETLAQAKAIRKKLLKNPKQFAEMAEKYSADEVSAAAGGRLQMSPAVNYVKEFANAIKPMSQEGEISDVVKSDFGFHIIMFHARKPAELKPFDSVKEAIVAKLKDDLMRKVQSEYVQTIRSLKIEADPEAIASLRTRYGELPEVPPKSERGNVAPATEAVPELESPDLK